MKRPTKARQQFYIMDRDGVTQSMIGQWLACRETCRLKYIEGWEAVGSSMALSFGTASHWMIQQAFDAPSRRDIDSAWVKQRIADLDHQMRKLMQTTRVSAADIQAHKEVMALLRVVMTAYFAQWKDDRKHRTDSEVAFNIPLDVDGETMRFRGKMDGIISRKDTRFLLETKNLSYIDEEFLEETLSFNFQVMFYLTALMLRGEDVNRVLYNVVRRPQNRRKVGESDADFAKRVAESIRDDPGHYFIRFEQPVMKAEITHWLETTLKPILREMRQWYHDLQDGRAERSVVSNYMNPFSLSSKYGRSDFYDWLVRGDRVNYVRKFTPFQEI